MSGFFAVLSLLLALGMVKANPACNADSMQACILPVIMNYAQTPEAQELAALQGTGRELDITATQLTSGCKLVKAMIDCGADYVTRCVEADVKDAHDFVRGTQTLMAVCDKPDLYEKTSTLITCGKSLQNNAAYKACSNSAKTKMDYLKNVKQPAAAIELLRSGRVMKDFCCVLKDVKTCTDPQIGSCSAEAVSLNQQVYDAVFSAYGCAAKTASGCA